MNSSIRILSAFAVIGAAGLLGACRGERSEKPPRQFFPDMDDSPKAKPQVKDEFFDDHRAMRPMIAGTVPFGQEPLVGTEPFAPAYVAVTRADYLREDDGFYKGVDAKGEMLVRIPSSVKVDRAFLERGQDRFNIYCSACHGYDGKGQGMAGVRFQVPPANLLNPKYSDPTTDKFGKDGYIFSVIRNGVNNNMPGYGHAMSERDTWAVIAYVRALQAAVTTDQSELDVAPPAERDAIRAAFKQAESATPAAAKPGATPPAAPAAPEKKP